MQLKLTIAAAALVAAFLCGWQTQGWRLEGKANALQAELAEAGADAVQAARAVEKARRAASDATAGMIVAELELESARGRVVTKRVIEYVQSPDAGQCDLPGDWVQTHDAAAGGVPGDAGATGSADDPARRATDIEALIVVTDNYALCRRELARLRGWQAWYREVSGAGN